MVRSDDPSDAHPTFADLLEDHGHRRMVESQSSVLCRNGNAEEPQFAHRGDEILRIHVVVVVPRCDGNDVVLDELSDQMYDLSAGLIRYCGHGLFSMGVWEVCMRIPPTNRARPGRQGCPASVR